MEGESVRGGQSFSTETSIVNVHILVVDDDATSLAIVSAMLRTMSYGVVTVRNALDALATLRLQKFDLVVTDLHMPEMNGLELQKRVEEEFKLPVIMMSADDNKSVMVESLQRGVTLYMVKPISPDDLKYVWQCVFPARKGKSIAVQEIRRITEESLGEKVSYADINSASSSVNAEKNDKKAESKRKALKKASENVDENNPAAPKKVKVIWTTSLHNRFLQAIRHIGLEKAVPKRILEFMNVPGLSRENVASHLQKYRIFLKRVTDRCGDGTSKGLSDRSLRSSFASGLLPSLLLQNVKFPQPQQITTSLFQPGVLGSSFLFPNKAASSGSSLPQLGHGRWHSLRNQANIQQSLYGHTNPLYRSIQPNINLGSNFASHGDLPDGIMNATNGTNVIQTCPNSSYTKGTYAGIELTSGGELVVRGRSTGFNGGVENDVNNGYGLMNGHNIVPLENWSTGGYMAQGGSSFAGFESINQWPPIFNVVNDQEENAWLIPPQDCCASDDLLNNISTTLGDIPDQVQQLGEDDLIDLFLEQNHNQTPDQCQEAQVNPPVNELQNPNLSASSRVEDHNAPSSEPSFVKNGNDRELVDSDELFGMMDQVETPSEGHMIFLNQEWEDEFVDSLIVGHADPYPKV